MELKLQYIYKESNILRGNFNISEELEKIYITYSTSAKIGSYGLLLIIKDPNNNMRMKKLLAEQEIVVLSNDSSETSVGGLSSNIIEGNWTIEIMVFTEYLKREILESGFEINISIDDKGDDIPKSISQNIWSTLSSNYNTDLYDWDEVYSVDKRWFKGDFHTHTNLSDGRETVTSVTKKAKDMSLDFYVPTEHNLVHTGWIDTDICILPGIEITSDKGHFNIFGVKDDPEYIMELMATSDEVYNNKIIDNAYENGSIVSINHPFLTQWKWQFKNTDLNKINTIEIINDPTYTDARKSNDACIKFMDILWNDGHKIYGVGGSDSHNLIDQYYEGATTPSIAGDPTTHVYMDKLTPNNIMENVKAGHMYVTRFCDLDFKIYSKDRSYLPGDEILNHKTGEGSCNEESVINVTYELTITDTEEEMDVYLVENGSYTKLETIDKVSNNKFITNIKFGSSYKWARLEIRNKNFEFRGFINPIYKGSKQTSYQTFSQALEHLEAEYD